MLLRVNNMDAVDRIGGHEASQAILQHLAGKVQQCIGTTDSHSRLGLNQIMVLLSNADRDRAQRFCAELSKTLENQPPGQIHLTASGCLSVTAGFVEARSDMPIEDLIARAQSPDNLFYEFKVC